MQASTPRSSPRRNQTYQPKPAHKRRSTNPAFGCDDPFPPCLVEPPGPVPVPHDTRSVLACDPPDYRNDKGQYKSECFLTGVGRSVPPDMEGADGVRRSNSAREGELEFEDVETTERHSEEDPDVGAAQCECDDTTAKELLHW